ncbi:hypothetical protein [Neorhizobium petrolearium]|uniref:Uncharacterized protein n=1 Tax=Neorhizobium petrolearium TaxID=515361 RepID=A0ABY8LZM5_9HYPH|nr:hypothetical protein [Neorhizobium petrolearium]MCC2612650.1 hypothetical protein [Neorhizobium petrolearium]WGI67773.1 hypothetical protein QEO92_22755 [Neorhizobium petrolearium]
MNQRVVITTRRRLEAKIEELIALLDLLDGDCDLEPYLADTYPADEDREEENEHGGDIQDEPHDAREEGNDEPSLGWSNPMGLRVHVPEEAAQMALDGWLPADVPDTALIPGDRGLTFDGDGHHIGRKLLREKIQDRRKAAKALDDTRDSPGYGKYV